MGNMGVSELRLVNPVDFLVEEARVRSADNEDILANAAVYESMEAAIGDCSFVVGTSARVRTISWPNLTPRESMVQVAKISERGENVALVFGPESAGLSNLQIDQCDVLVRIPVSEDSPSINLAGAVLILLYELRLAEISSSDEESADDETLERKYGKMATQDQIQGFFEHLQTVMEDVEFIHSRPREKLMRKIRRIFIKPGLTEDEVNILRGLLTSINRMTRGAREKSE